MSLADLESFTASPNAPDYVGLDRYLYIDSAGADALIGTNALGGACLDVHGFAAHWWRRRLFRPAGIGSGTRGGRTLVAFGTLTWGWYDAVNGVVQCSVEFDASVGQVRAYRGDRWNGGGGTLLAQTGLMAFVPGSEFFAEAQVTIGTGSSGALTVRINAETAITLSGIATQTSGSALFHTTQDAWTYAGFGSGSQCHTQQSDLYWTDALTWLGPGRVFGLRPAANGAALGFTPSAGTNWQNVSAAPPGGDTAYNVSSVVGAKDLFQTSAGASGIAVAGLMLSRNSRADAAGTRSGQSLLVSAGVTGAGAVTDENTGYTTWFDTFDTDPATGLPFTVSAVNLAQPGYMVAS
jgi:hypothetical protein